jgi:hypothetical protein
MIFLWPLAPARGMLAAGGSAHRLPRRGDTRAGVIPNPATLFVDGGEGSAFVLWRFVLRLNE